LNLFLDSSVAIAATLSVTGASREVFNLAPSQGWRLLVSPWIIREVHDNLFARDPEAIAEWSSLQAKAVIEPDELIFEWPIVFEESKDKPVLFTALASADVLLTLDRRDFRELWGKRFTVCECLRRANSCAANATPDDCEITRGWSLRKFVCVKQRA
jgi:predicted nucleic acid-binding protein